MAIFTTQGGNGSPVRMISPAENARITAQQAQLMAEEARKNQNHQKLLNIGKLAAFAIPTAGAGLSAAGAGAAASPAFGIGAANTGTWGGVGMTPAAYGGGGATAGKFSMGNLLNLGQLGASLFGNLFGQRSQNRANDQAMQMQQQQFAQQQALVERQQVEDQRRWEAEEAFRAKQLAASEEERLYARTLSEKQQRLLDEAEARKAPRRALSQQALIRISELLNARPR